MALARTKPLETGDCYANLRPVHLAFQNSQPATLMEENAKVFNSHRNLTKNTIRASKIKCNYASWYNDPQEVLLVVKVADQIHSVKANFCDGNVILLHRFDQSLN